MAEHDPKTPASGPIPDPHAQKPAPRQDHLTRTPEDAATIRPDQDEDLGPVPELFGAAGTEAAAFASGDDDLEAAAIEKGAEAEGVESAQILGLLVAVVVVLILAVVAIFFLTSRVGQHNEAAHIGVMRYPELTELRLEAERLVGAYGISDDEGSYRVPLTQAQQAMAREYRTLAASAGMAQAPDSRVAFNLAFPRYGLANVPPTPETSRILSGMDAAPMGEQPAGPGLAPLAPTEGGSPAPETASPSVPGPAVPGPAVPGPTERAPAAPADPAPAPAAPAPIE
jgi:hypothetical protein